MKKQLITSDDIGCILLCVENKMEELQDEGYVEEVTYLQNLQKRLEKFQKHIDNNI